MNTKLLASFAAATLGTTLASTLSALPAQALSFSSPGPFTVTEDTSVQFDFLVSHGAYKSSFGVLNVGSGLTTLLKEVAAYDAGSGEANDWKGTTSDPMSAVYKFLAGESYQLVYSSEGHGSTNDFLVDSDGSYTFRANGPNANPATYETIDYDGLILAFEDGWEASHGKTPDYNDMIIGVKSQSTPEPVSVVGLTALGLLGALRRRQGLKS